VKTRRGAFGQTLSFVEGLEYVRRLNDAFDGDWSFEVLDHKIVDGQVIVLARLVAGGVSKMSFGGSTITLGRETGQPVSLADDLKAAATDALKKAASLLGVGLYLYGENTDNQAPADPNNGGHVDRAYNGGNGGARVAPKSGNGGNGRGSNNNGNRLTQKQLSAIWKLGRKLQMNAEEIRERSRQIFGVVPEFLSKADASSLISEFADELGGNPV